MTDRTGQMARRSTGGSNRAVTPSRRSGAGKLDPDELAALEEERDFLLASLRDLDLELEAGDLDPADHETLRDEYTARAAEILRAIRDRRQAFEEARRPRSTGRTIAILAGAGAFALLAGLLVARYMGARGVEDTATGGIGAERSPNQRALDCQQFFEPGDPDEGIACYEDVLRDDPRNVVASTWLAWLLETSAGPDADPAAQERVEELLEAALRQRPDYSHALAFRAIVTFRHGRPEEAARQLEEFLATDPAPDALTVIEDFQLSARIEEAIGSDPVDREVARCRTLRSREDPIEALECFRTVLEGDPDNVAANTWMAFQLEETATFLPEAEAASARRQAEMLLDRALAVEPEDPFALVFRSIFALNHGDRATAREMYDRLMAVDPPDDALVLVDEADLEARLGVTGD